MNVIELAERVSLEAKRNRERNEGATRGVARGDAKNDPAQPAESDPQEALRNPSPDPSGELPWVEEEILEAFAEPAPATWTGESLALIAWLDRLDPSVIPAGTELRRGERICDPGLWLTALKRDAAAGPRGPRAGVLIDDILILKALVEGEAAA